jgi:hypothetical protein
VALTVTCQGSHRPVRARISAYGSSIDRFAIHMAPAAIRSSYGYMRTQERSGKFSLSRCFRCRFCIRRVKIQVAERSPKYPPAIRIIMKDRMKGISSDSQDKAPTRTPRTRQKTVTMLNRLPRENRGSENSEHSSGRGGWYSSAL